MEIINWSITCRIDMMQIIDNRFLGTYQICTNWHWGNTYDVLAAVWMEVVWCEFV